MKHTFYLLVTIHLLIMPTFSNTMEKSTIPNANFKQLMTAIEPRQALYLTNNRIAISDEKGCCIIDPTTDKEILKISDKKHPYIAIDRHQEKIAIAYDKSVKIYNAQTGTMEWRTEKPLYYAPILACIFSPLHNTIFISYTNTDVTTHHYYDNQTSPSFTTGLSDTRLGAPIIALHPTQHQRCYAHNPGTVDIHDEKEHKIRTIVSTHAIHYFCEYSPDGSVIAIGNYDDVYIVDPISGQQQALQTQNNDQVMTIKFHPNSAVLALLSRFSGTVSYWDMLTYQCISIIPPTLCCNALLYKPVYKRYALSFSPDGKNLLVTIPGKSVVTPVPFEVIYQPDTKEKAPFIYWLLKNYSSNQNHEIPNEIIQLLMYNVLETYKR